MKKKKTTTKIKPKEDIVTFWDNKGNKVHIPGNLTIAEAVKRYHIRDIKIESLGSFLPDGWYAHPKPKKGTK